MFNLFKSYKNEKPNLPKVSKLSAISTLKKIFSIISIIDKIEVNKNIVKIYTSKDIMIQNNGNFVNFTKGLNVQFGKEIHLNPEIKFDMNKDMEEVKDNINQKNIEFISDNLKSSKCSHSNKCNH